MQYKCRMQNAKCRIKGEATLPNIIKLRGTFGVLWSFCFMSAKRSERIYAFTLLNPNNDYTCLTAL